MEQLIQTLSWIAAALQVPVVVAILYLLARGLLALGGFYGLWSDRQRWRRRIGADNDGHLPEASIGTLVAALGGGRRQAQPLQLAAAALQQAPTDAAWHERVITAFELDTDRQLGLYRTMTRIGPLLGLMGTLIPLGPALVGLASGDISLLARKMEVAFATTVVGLVIGAMGFLLHQSASRWALDDLSLLEFLSSKLREKP
ncbi:MotA/TolQ/ExbB proton channel family protein [Pollutimonas bauzanensis]|uniref:Biopolymer transport protein ExbB/TolQ n=1 Tax=Pollutimonas bauzanensis TaxID=658167 RepID=A0A1M5LT12_9BURK|nr:MotA/TolQ/ExbB proton channel family protein [Pollutimonas bauzanensis]SHG68227.1 Biopolymer transport protein ExbB/TolQ [Pollutimonas bauzanensis]